jgi:hypothetical protein
MHVSCSTRCFWTLLRWGHYLPHPSLSTDAEDQLLRQGLLASRGNLILRKQIWVMTVNKIENAWTSWSGHSKGIR